MGEQPNGTPARGSWDWESDVVIAGYGFGGAITAIAAHDAGAQVLLLEKAIHPGGNSLVSGGGLSMAYDAEQALAYLLTTSGGRTDEAVLRAFAQGLTELEPFLLELARAAGVQVQYAEQNLGGTYPFPGGETIWFMKMAPIPGFDGYPWAVGLRAGARLWKVVSDNVAMRPAITVHTSTPVSRLITGADGAVLGLFAEHEGREIAIKARRAVVLATGGFENDPELRTQYFECQPVYPVCTLSNTGDGIRMAQKVGAALWHMWHFHGGYGFKFPEFPFAFRHPFRGPRRPDAQMPWIAVDKHARRFMDEYPPAPQDTGARALEYYDADRQEFPRIPCYLIFDEKGRRAGPIADTIINSEEHHYIWSEDNEAEIARGWLRRAPSLAALATDLGLPTDALEASVAQWNEHCAAGADPAHGRLPGTLMTIDTPPYYGIPAWPIVSNTQGGPVHNAEQRVLDPFGQPIPRLFAVGELGSLFGHLYLEAGNNAECFVGGRIAGRLAAAEMPWAESLLAGTTG
jgi:succinate dehydrogenase/fumarate reductase flavoprotein subunit